MPCSPCSASPSQIQAAAEQRGKDLCGRLVGELGTGERLDDDAALLVGETTWALRAAGELTNRTWLACTIQGRAREPDGLVSARSLFRGSASSSTFGTAVRGAGRSRRGRTAPFAEVSMTFMRGDAGGFQLGDQVRGSFIPDTDARTTSWRTVSASTSARDAGTRTAGRAARETGRPRLRSSSTRNEIRRPSKARCRARPHRDSAKSDNCFDTHRSGVRLR